MHAQPAFTQRMTIMVVSETSAVKSPTNICEISSNCAETPEGSSNMPPSRRRKRRHGAGMTTSSKGLALHLVLSACSSVAVAAAAAAAPRDSSACFVSSHTLGPLHSQSLRSIADEFVRETHAQDVLSIASRGQLRCPPVSSTLSPHSLHTPTPMHSTKEGVSLDQAKNKNTKPKSGGNGGSASTNDDDDWFIRTSDSRGAHAELSVRKLQALTIEGSIGPTQRI